MRVDCYENECVTLLSIEMLIELVKMDEEFVCPYAYDQWSRIHHCSENMNRNISLKCVECSRRVCHVKGGARRRDHFRHVSKRRGGGGGGGGVCHGGESMVHRLYKQYVAQNIQSLRVVRLCHGCSRVCGELVDGMFESCSARVEYGIKAGKKGNSYIVDVGVFDNTGGIVAAVEIVKTHRCEREKRTGLAYCGVTLIELFISDNNEMVRNGVLVAQCYVYKVGSMSCADCIRGMYCAYYRGVYYEYILMNRLRAWCRQAKFIVRAKVQLHNLQVKNGIRVMGYYVPARIRNAVRSWCDRAREMAKIKSHLYGLQRRNKARIGNYYVPVRIRDAIRGWCNRAIVATEKMKQERVKYYYDILNGIEQTTVEMFITCSRCKTWFVDFGKDEWVTKVLYNVKISNFKMSEDAIRYILDTEYARYSDIKKRAHKDIESFRILFTSISNREMDRMDVHVKRFKDRFRVVRISADLLNASIILDGYDESRYYRCKFCYRNGS